MEDFKEFIKPLTDTIGKVMLLYGLVCLYPFVSFLLYNYLDIDIILKSFEEELIGGAIYYSLVGLSIPTYLWCILYIWFKNIHPIVTIVYFVLFNLTGILCFIGAFIAIGYGM